MRSVSLFLLFLAAACGGPAATDSYERPEISPDQFALLPCGELEDERPCALAIAGGKRLLFGAPANILPGLSADDLRQLDALIVFSLRAQDLEGMDDVRNASWRAGRDAPLIVIGPPGIDAVITALNKAYEQSDALRIVEEGIPPGGYDAAILEARPALTGSKVFDTGDLQVHRRSDGYTITYDRTHTADLLDCAPGTTTSPVTEATSSTVTIACGAMETGSSWPLAAPLFVKEN